MAEIVQINDQTESQKRAAEQLRDRLKGIVRRMEATAAERVGRRRHIEQRWIHDLELYHGSYDAETQRKLRENELSQLFINMVRPKTDAMSARLMDLLFPTDDKNFGINPTPVPRMTKDAEEAASRAQQMEDQAARATEAGSPQQEQLAAQAQAARDEADKAGAILDEARRRAELMETEIEDQLKESNYHAVKRDQIEDACKLGTGVTKGPVVGDRVRKGWQRNEDGQFALAMSAGEQPAMRYVDIWNFFPDMDARSIEESEGVYERHLMNMKKLRTLANLPGFDADAIRRLLKEKPRTAAPAYISDLRKITAANDQVAGDLYHVWEYTGPLDAEDMRDIAMAMSDMETLNDLEDIDPLTELNAVVWFCQGEILKFAIYPYDSGECIYSVFNLARDEASVFGYGIPAIMRDPQASLNAAWRNMMDNAALSGGPQIVVAQSHVEPLDGDWTLRPRKVWLSKEGLPQNRPAFEVFSIPAMQGEMQNIIGLSMQFIDYMTAMPALAQGEQGTGVTKTAQGMAMLMNSTNVVFRRIVKNFDDDVTVPDIRRFYDWNMQHSPKEEIKGDYEVDARGSSVLLVREMQAQNLMMIALQLGAHPVYGPMLKNRDLLRKLFQAHMIPADEIMLSETEIDAVLAKAAAQQQEQASEQSAEAIKAQIDQAKLELERDKLAAEIEIENMKASNALIIAELNHETQMMKLAETFNMKMEDIAAKLTNSREQRTLEAAKMAAEARVTRQDGASGGGYF